MKVYVVSVDDGYSMRSYYSIDKVFLDTHKASAYMKEEKGKSGQLHYSYRQDEYEVSE